MLGEDLRRIMDKLDYIQDLGINTKYLAPIFQAVFKFLYWLLTKVTYIEINIHNVAYFYTYIIFTHCKSIIGVDNHRTKLEPMNSVRVMMCIDWKEYPSLQVSSFSMSNEIIKLYKMLILILFRCHIRKFFKYFT